MSKVKATADAVRAFLTAFSSTLEKDGMFLQSAHFERDEATGELRNIRLSYEERKGGEG